MKGRQSSPIFPMFMLLNAGLWLRLELWLRFRLKLRLRLGLKVRLGLGLEVQVRRRHPL